MAFLQATLAQARPVHTYPWWHARGRALMMRSNRRHLLAICAWTLAICGMFSTEGLALDAAACTELNASLDSGHDDLVGSAGCR